MSANPKKAYTATFEADGHVIYRFTLRHPTETDAFIDAWDRYAFARPPFAVSVDDERLSLRLEPINA